MTMEYISNSVEVNLIVLTDFSVAADNALNYALNFAQIISASVYLVHIWDNSILNPNFFIISHPYNTEKKIKNALQERSLEYDKNVVIKPVLLKGTFTDQLPEFIKKIPNA